MPRINKNFPLRPRSLHSKLFGTPAGAFLATASLQNACGPYRFYVHAPVHEMTVLCRGRIGRPHKNERNLNMATIALLTKQKDGGFSGTLILPSLTGVKIVLAPVEKQTEKGPAYRVTIGAFEAGAAWMKTSKAGKAYISVKLSEPSFHGGSIYPVLVKSATAGYLLEWNPQPIKRRPELHADERF